MLAMSSTSHFLALICDVFVMNLFGYCSYVRVFPLAEHTQPAVLLLGELQVDLPINSPCILCRTFGFHNSLGIS
jgi:hypothetical protein